jgi:hypothetical protein
VVDEEKDEEEEEEEEEKEEGTWLRAAAGTDCCIPSRKRLTPASQRSYLLPPFLLLIIVDVGMGLSAAGIERGLASCERLEAGRGREQVDGWISRLPPSLSLSSRQACKRPRRDDATVCACGRCVQEM